MGINWGAIDIGEQLGDQGDNTKEGSAYRLLEIYEREIVGRILWHSICMS